MDIYGGYFPIKKVVKATLLICVILFFISLTQKDKLPDKKLIRQELYQEPIQTEAKAQPFEKKVRGEIYNIVPLYDYKLYGLVVSFSNRLSWFDYYREISKDFINPKDICVIYGENIKSEVYKLMKFSSDVWYCQTSFKLGSAQDVISKFKDYCLSNNHLLPSNKSISKTIMNIKRGDQVYLEGHLVKYINKKWKNCEGCWRGTSITRTDRGNGACETIYITKLVILAEANLFWRFIHSLTINV